MPIVELQSLPTVRIGHVGPVVVSVWYAEATVDALQALNAQQRKLIAQYGRLSSVSVAMTIPRAPGADVAEQLKETEKEFKGTSLGTVVVVLERGLAAIIARSFIAVASLITSSPITVVKTLEEAVEKLRAMPGQPPEVLGQTRLVAELEAFIKR